MLEDRLRKSRVSEYTIIRDDVFEKFLEELVKTEVRNNVVLQGGNALRFGYGSPRYSNDLDFVLRDNEIDSEKFAKICESLSRVASAIKGYVGAVRIKKVKERLYRIKFRIELPKGPLSAAFDLYNIGSHDYSKKNVGNGQLMVESPNEIFADKVLADIERLQGRGSLKTKDVSDWYYILHNFEIDDEKIVDLIILKVKEYDLRIDVETFNRLINWFDSHDHIQSFYEDMTRCLPDDVYQALLLDTNWINVIRKKLIKLKNMYKNR